MKKLSVQKKSRRNSAGLKCSLCDRKKEIDFHGDGAHYPVFSCPEHGPDKRNEWELWWNEYKDLWKDDSAWESPKNRIACIVGYMCHKYLEFYGAPYIFSYSSPNPYKDKDFIMARRLLTMITSAKIVKNYIDWVYAKRIRTTKYNITSFGFFASQKFVNEYLQARARRYVIKRTTKLPKDFLLWCHDNYSNVLEKVSLETWNDLNGLVSFVKSYGFDNDESLIVIEAVRRGMLPPGPEYRKLEG